MSKLTKARENEENPEVRMRPRLMKIMVKSKGRTNLSPKNCLGTHMLFGTTEGQRICKCNIFLGFICDIFPWTETENNN